MVGVAVIGLGAIGRLHANNVARDLGGARLTMVVDEAAGLARCVADDLGASWSTSSEDALADGAVDAVVIAVPTPLHPQLVELAAAAGKHVFCEKPLGLCPTRAAEAVQAARHAGVHLQVGFQRRFDPDFVEAKRRIDQGSVGTIRFLRIAHRNAAPPHPGSLQERLGSIYVDMTVHDFDTARWLVGDPAEVSAVGLHDAAVVSLRFPDGALGVIDNMRAAGYGFECSAELVGTDSTLRIGGRQQVADVHCLIPGYIQAQLPSDHICRHRAAYRAELSHFVSCLEADTEPVVGGQDAVEALRLAGAAEQCAA